MMTQTVSSHRHKEVIIVRHGQAQHNPRAEVAKANGCSMEEFIALMREDDALDAALTEEGRRQARAARLAASLAAPIQLVVSSSLSRALETADHVHPPSTAPTTRHTRVCCEHFREINGDMLNAKRRTKSELAASFPDWNWDELESEEDSLWTPILEEQDAAAERGYLGLRWLMERPEDHIVLVSHGGILRHMMSQHPLVVMRDERNESSSSSSVKKAVDSRFDNCELRRYRMSWMETPTTTTTTTPTPDHVVEDRRAIVLTQIDHDLVEEKELLTEV